MCIYTDDDDRRRFLDELERVVEQYRLACHAYCLMSNHYHLVVQTLDANLSSAVRQLNGCYAQWWNRRFERVGHVWQGRFKAQRIEGGTYFHNACRYVVLNPVEAGVVSRAEDWRWSSYAATAGLTRCPRFLTTAMILGPDGRKACTAYRAFVAAGVADTPVVDALRADLRIIGTDTFTRAFRSELEDADPVEVPRRERLLARPDLATVFQGVEDRAMRDTRIREARRCYGYDLSAIAGFLGLHYSTVSRIARTHRRTWAARQS